MFFYIITIPFLFLIITSIKNIYFCSKKNKFIFNDYLQWIFCLMFGELFIFIRYFRGWVFNYIYVYLIISFFVVFIIIKMFKALISMKKNKEIKDFLDFKLIDDKSFFYIIIGIPIVISYIITFFIGLF